MNQGHRLIYGDARSELMALPPGFADLVVLDPGASQHFLKAGSSPIGRQQLPETVPWLEELSAATGRGGSSQMNWARYVHAVVAESRRVLHSGGNLVFESDVRDAALVRMILDSVMGPENFRNEIVRRRGASTPTVRGFPTTTSRLVYYVVSQKEAYFDNTREGRRSSPVSEIVDQQGVPLASARPLKVATDVWSFPDLPVKSPERFGVRGQDPVPLATRIIRAMSPPSGVVIDPFCGSGTFLEAAHKLGRLWVGIDNDYAAVTTVKHRASLLGLGGQELQVIGDPEIKNNTNAVAPEAFELWVLGELGARPSSFSTGEERGSDGVIYRHVAGRSTPVRILVQVKAGQSPVGRQEILALAGLLELQGADMGVMIGRSGFTREAMATAESYGFATVGDDVLPRIQAVEYRALVDGYKPLLPSTR